MKTNLNVDTQSLREKILDLAMRGKLIKQDAGDEPASVLLERIKAEKAELVKEGKIKKSKKLPEITDDENPFDIPDNWRWVRLGDVVFNYDGMRIPLSISDRKNREKIYDYYGASGVIDKVDTYLFDRTLLLISEDGANLIARNKPIAFLATGKYWVNNHAHVVDGVDISLLTFISLVINGMNISDYISGTAQPKLTQANLNRLPIPLPPLAEQRRIADKVSELFSQIDVIEKNAAEYQDLEQAMRSKLLDLAMRGKLIEQDPNDEPASELLEKIQAEKAELVKEGKIKKGKKLPDITDDEKPFDIPDSWEWVRLGDICTKLVDGDHNPPKGKKTKTKYIMASSRNINRDTLVDLDAVRYLDEDTFNKENERTMLQKGDILFTSVGSLGRSCIYVGDLNLCFQRSVSVLTTQIFNQYLKYFLDSPYYQKTVTKHATGTAQKGFYLKQMAVSMIAVPPLAEQKRIVAKLEELFEQLDIINNNLVSAS